MQRTLLPVSFAGGQVAPRAAAPPAAAGDQGRREVAAAQERAHSEGGDVPFAASILQMDPDQELQGIE